MRKKTRMILLILFVPLSLIVATGLFVSSRLLSLGSNIQMVGSNGEQIPAAIYKRILKVKIGKQEETVEELVVLFDERLNIENGLDVLIIVPKYKLVGIPEGGRRMFKKVAGENYIYQVSRKADEFTQVVNNTALFDDPPIKFAHFNDKEIVFNSFQRLKKYGSNIIIKY